MIAANHCLPFARLGCFVLAKFEEIADQAATGAEPEKTAAPLLLVGSRSVNELASILSTKFR
jgi:hypothetical protein